MAHPLIIHCRMWIKSTGIALELEILLVLLVRWGNES